MSASKASTLSPGIDAQRLWHDLQEMGKIGATPTGGVCRLTGRVAPKANIIFVLIIFVLQNWG